MSKVHIKTNLTDDELYDVLKSLSEKKKKKTKLRLPADNPAQAELSEKVLFLYKKIMVDSLGKQLKEFLDKVE